MACSVIASSPFLTTCGIRILPGSFSVYSGRSGSVPESPGRRTHRWVDAANVGGLNLRKAGLQRGSRPISKGNKSAPFVTLGPMNTTALSTRRPMGINPKGGKLQQLPRGYGYKLPEYLKMAEVNALIAAAPNPRARLIMLEQWRAGLRVSEALALEARDLHLDSDRPTRRRSGGKSRLWLRNEKIALLQPAIPNKLNVRETVPAAGEKPKDHPCSRGVHQYTPSVGTPKSALQMSSAIF